MESERTNGMEKMRTGGGGTKEETKVNRKKGKDSVGNGLDSEIERGRECESERKGLRKRKRKRNRNKKRNRNRNKKQKNKKQKTKKQ